MHYIFCMQSDPHRNIIFFLKSQKHSHILTKFQLSGCTYQARMMLKYKNTSSARKNPTQRPLHPRPAGSFQAKSKSQSALETSSSTMCSSLSSEQTVTADFILDPPPTCKKWAWGVFFLESEASHVKSPENPYGNTSCGSSGDACVLINQVTLVSSSSRLPSRVQCTLRQLLPPVITCQIMHIQIHNKYVENLSFFTASVNP